MTKIEVRDQSVTKIEPYEDEAQWVAENTADSRSAFAYHMLGRAKALMEMAVEGGRRGEFAQDEMRRWLATHDLRFPRR